jgi:hypothetical protein
VDRRRRLLEQLDRPWMAFRESYAGLAEAVVLTPGITKAWSVKDVIAHVTTWEEEALKHLPAILDGQKPPRYSVVYGGIDAFNALMRGVNYFCRSCCLISECYQLRRCNREHR